MKRPTQCRWHAVSVWRWLGRQQVDAIFPGRSNRSLFALGDCSQKLPTLAGDELDQGGVQRLRLDREKLRPHMDHARSTIRGEECPLDTHTQRPIVRSPHWARACANADRLCESTSDDEGVPRRSNLRRRHRQGNDSPRGANDLCRHRRLRARRRGLIHARRKRQTPRNDQRSARRPGPRLRRGCEDSSTSSSSARTTEQTSPAEAH